MTDALLERHRAALNLVVDVAQVLGHDRAFHGRNVLVVRAPIAIHLPPGDARMSTGPGFRSPVLHLRGNETLDDIDWSAWCGYPEWIVWSGATFQTQLGAARVLNAVRESGVEPPPTRLAFRGVDWGNEPPQRLHAVTDEDWEHAAELVAAVERPTPEWIPALAAESDRRVPTPWAARELLDYLPTTGDGLTRLERIILETTRRLTGNGRRQVRCAKIVGQVVGGLMEKCHVGSRWIWWHLDRLQGSHHQGERLLDPAHLGTPRPRFGAYRVGELGNAVLDGEAHRFDRDHTFDRWLCGTHLSWADDNVWVRDGLEVRRWPTHGVPAKERLIVEPEPKPRPKRAIPTAHQPPRPDVEISPGLTRLGRPALGDRGRTDLTECALSADGRALWIMAATWDAGRRGGILRRRDLDSAATEVCYDGRFLHSLFPLEDGRIACVLSEEYNERAGEPWVYDDDLAPGVHLLDPATGTLEFVSVPPEGFASDVCHPIYSISHDGRWLAWTVGMDLVVRDLEAGESWWIGERFPSAGVPYVANDGSVLISRVWDHDEGEGWAVWRLADRREVLWRSRHDLEHDGLEVFAQPTSDGRRMLCWTHRARSTVGELAVPSGEFVAYPRPLSARPMASWLRARQSETIFAAILDGGDATGIVALDHDTGILERLYQTTESSRLELASVGRDGRIVVWTDDNPAMIEEDEPPRSGSRMFVLDRDRAERGYR